MPFECSVRSILDAKQLLSQLTREMAIRLVSIRERTLEKTALYQTFTFFMQSLRVAWTLGCILSEGYASGSIGLHKQRVRETNLVCAALCGRRPIQSAHLFFLAASVNEYSAPSSPTTPNQDIMDLHMLL
jgi:hypothetical protein